MYSKENPILEHCSRNGFLELKFQSRIAINSTILLGLADHMGEGIPIRLVEETRLLSKEALEKEKKIRRFGETDGVSFIYCATASLVALRNGIRTH